MTLLGEMRSTGLRRLLVYCGNYMCAHSVTMNADRWSDDLSRCSCARLAAIKAPTSGHYLIENEC
jgi:hypothetical protein